MLRSISRRIALPYILLIVGIVAVLGVYFSTVLRQNHLRTLETETAAQARLAAAAIVAGASSEQIDRLAQDWSALLGKRVTLIGRDGVVIGDSDGNRLAMENHAGRPEVMQARLTGSGVEIRPSATLGINMMYVAAPDRLDGELLGFAHLAAPLANIRGEQNRLLGALLLVASIAGLSAAALAAWIAGRTTRPLRRLAEAAEQVAGGRLESRLIPTTPDETGLLTETLQEGALDDPPAARSFLARMVTEVDALSQMVEELLELTPC